MDILLDREDSLLGEDWCIILRIRKRSPWVLSESSEASTDLSADCFRVRLPIVLVKEEETGESFESLTILGPGVVVTE